MTDTFGGGSGGCDRCDVRYAVLDRAAAQVAVVVDAFLACGGVDDELQLSVGHHVEDVRAAFIQLVYALCRDACFADRLAGVACGYDLEAVFVEGAGESRSLGAVTLVDGDQDGALHRQLAS